MAINAAQVLSSTCLLLDVSWTLCRSRNLCFCCLSPIVPGMHTGSLNCPNPPVSVERCKAFVDRTCSTSQAQISSIFSSLSLPPPLTYTSHSTPAPSSFFEDVATDLDLHYPQEGGFDELYGDYDESSCPTVSVHILTIHICLNCLIGSCLLFPVQFRSQGALIPATILMDTGAMANFIN